MPRQPLKVQRLHLAADRVEDIGLGAAGIAVEQDQPDRQRVLVERLRHQAAIGAITALQHLHPEPDLPQDHAHGARALPAPPAIDQRAIAAGLGREMRVDMVRDVARDQGRPDLARLQTALLHVDRADARALHIVEHGQVDGTGQVILREFGRRARVDDLVEAGAAQIGEGSDGETHAPHIARRHHFRQRRPSDKKSRK